MFAVILSLADTLDFAISTDCSISISTLSPHAIPMQLQSTRQILSNNKQTLATKLPVLPHN